MMILSEDQLLLLEQYAAVFFSYKEIALLLEINIDDFMEEVENENSVLFKKCEMARLKSEFDLRTEIVKMAKMGSPAAQTEALKLISKNQINNIR
jgi:predicted DNA-binding protein YlxM (UPF0122 family)